MAGEVIFFIVFGILFICLAGCFIFGSDNKRNIHPSSIKKKK